MKAEGFRRSLSRISPVPAASLLVILSWPLLGGAATESVLLELKEAASPVHTISFSGQSVGAFDKEPQVGKDARRGLLNFPGAPEPIPYLWDFSNSRLWLDCNRNKDLTDDSENGYGPASKSGPYHTFTNLHLRFPGKDRTQECVMDLQFYGSPGYRVYTAHLKTYWEAKANLSGAEWQVGIIEPPGQAELGTGWLLVRPWGRRNQPFAVEDGGADAVSFQPNLFLDRQGYAVSCRPEGPDGRLRLEFAPKDYPLGQLKLEGRFVERLVLMDRTARMAVVLNAPGGSMGVPASTKYESPTVVLAAGSVRATLQNRYSSKSVAYKVTATEPLVLTEGGPLTNTVALSRRGVTLNMAYNLVGAGGRPYSLVGPRPEPRFSVLRAGKEIRSGKFEYG